jgi:thiamine-monophosphate kinase
MPAFPRALLRNGFGAAGPTLAEVGERALLERLIEIAEAVADPAGDDRNGDDAAIWRPPPGHDLAVSIDAVVEGVDFRRDWISPHQLGRKAFAVAASDLAGMGAQVVNCVATLCARGSEQFEDVIEIQRGLCEAAASCGCAVVGGDVSAIDGPLVIDVCVTGSLPGGRALRRSAGREGDVLMVSGVIGRAAAGLRLLRESRAPGDVVETQWIEAQLQPPSRLAEGRRLLDAARTARACGCAAELWADSLPVDAPLRDRFGAEWLELAGGGGEDFELLVAVAQQDAMRLLTGWPAELAPLTAVGMLRAGSGVQLLDRRDGTPLAMPASAAEHFT